MFTPANFPLLHLRIPDEEPTYEVTPISRFFTLEFERASSPRPGKTGGAWGIHWWLVRDGKPVGYCKTVLDPREAVPHVLMEIEIRRQFRGMGLTKILTKAVTESTGLQLHSTGNWTESGARALTHLPLAPGYVGEVSHPEAIYVKDWDSRQPRYW